MRSKEKGPKSGSDLKNNGKGKPGVKDDQGIVKLKGAQQINIRHILCEKHSKKEEALQKLKSGAKFDDVARSFSEDKARVGGALGWKKRGDLDPTFENVAFALEVSTTTNPKFAEAKTEFGYHIMMVEGRS